MKFIIGNWKMNGNMADKENMLKKLQNIKTRNKIVLCLPFILLNGKNYNIDLGAQDVSNHENGAFTGDISGKMLKDAGIKYVIVGHSERRTFHKETNGLIKEKATMAIKNGIIPVICIGETKEQKNAGRTKSVIKKMLLASIPETGKYIIAYEPRWAIGAGKTPNIHEIASVFQTIFKTLQSVGKSGTPIIYGGSVKSTNAKDIIELPHVDGLLIGGASLKSDTFIPIIKSID